MTGVRGKSPKPGNRKDVLQFSPNFTVYVLPPDVVCLYSENRKFFLHGTLYCALAAAIGADGRSSKELVRTLEKEFPLDQIQEALKRLLERRYVLPASPSSSGAAAAYWTSIGLPPDIADKNLHKCRVRVQSIDVEGAEAMIEALTELGVNVVKRSPDLTITLVNDYLEEQLADLNWQHLSDRTPWLLVQPSGIFPLVGPVLKPRETACWACLADRMIRNREIKGLLHRRQAQRVAASPLAHGTIGHGGIQLAATEIAKAIATDFRTDLTNHIISVDLLGSEVARHYVPRRPQCQACGNKKVWNPRRAPEPIELGSGGKLVMTSGGYRSVSPGATVARFRKLVSPLTGVVSSLERIDVDLPMNTNFYAKHNFSGPSDTVDQLRAGLSGGSYGKGSTAEQGEASALMEAIERYSGIFQGDEIRAPARFADFPRGEAIAPNDVQLFSAEQFSRGQAPSPHLEEPEMPDRFDPSAELEWSPVWSLRDKRFKHFPTGLLYFFYSGAPGAIHADSNGCAAGNTRDEAIVQGFLELVERDAYSIWWYNRVQRPQLDLNQFGDTYVRELRSQLTDAGRKLWVLDVTGDLGVPTYVAITHWMQDGKENIEFGSGSHFDPRIALLRAMTELNQFLAIGLMNGGRGDKSSLDGTTPLHLKNYPYLTPNDVAPVDGGATSEFGKLHARDQVMACIDIAKKAGLDFLVLDQTRPDIEVPVVRVIVPGMRHFYRRFAPGRLYDVPIKLGWLAQPRAQSELNPILPHT
jgi:oxazoline/thiazoline synthase